MLAVRRRPASIVACLTGVVVPDDVAEAVVEVSVGTAELLLDGECSMVLGRTWVAPTVRLRVANVTLCRPSSTLSIIQKRWLEKLREMVQSCRKSGLDLEVEVPRARKVGNLLGMRRKWCNF
jgi:hypothetical protein